MGTETIAAISTAMGNSGIGIVRISGDGAFQVIDRIYRAARGKKKLSLAKSHTVHYGYIYDGKKMIDEAMVLILRSPHTYTAEDTVEIDCHGGALVMRRILEAAVKNGARPAEPGEFTKRAFLNGRIDLSQAESVMDVISAKNDFALESSLQQLRGSVREEIQSIRAAILHEIAFLESALDDPEHISIEGYGERLLSLLEGILERVRRLMDSSENGRLLKEGIDTVIAGKPNVGKSSLLNFLTGKDRAIVTEVAGTTRDILEEQVLLDGIALNVMDTAGIHDTQDVVEKIGVEKSKKCLLNADLILILVDSSLKLEKEDFEIFDLIKDKKAIVLLNKSDLEQAASEEDVRAFLEREGLECPVLSISAKTGDGIALLRDQIKQLFFHGEISFNDEISITNVRQKAALSSALESLLLVKKSIEDGMPEDFYSIDLMDAYQELGKIIGESVGEDLVNEIFSKFCMGK